MDTLVIDCFLHYFDIHFLNERQKYTEMSKMENEIFLATKMAFFCSSSFLIPTASYFENAICKKICDDIMQIIPNFIYFVCNDITLYSFMEKKLYQYKVDSKQHEIYTKEYDNIDSLHIKKKNIETTGFIENNWKNFVDSEKFKISFASYRRALPPNFYELCKNLDERIEGFAYTPEYVNTVLFDNDTHYDVIKLKVSSIINKFYFESYLKSFPSCSVITDMDYLHSDYVDNIDNVFLIPYRAIFKKLKECNFLNIFLNSSFKDISMMKSKDNIVNLFREAIENFYKVTTQRQNYFVGEKNMGTNIINMNGINTLINGNNNTTNVTDINWKDIEEDVKKIKSTDENLELLPALEKAVKDKDNNKFINILKKFNINKLKSFGANVLAGIVANNLGT